ncbi:hypothetical protein BK654_17880 [Pseudomonas brassicacearum]|nr:hypothetical protein BK654_17880 [Pseudomonas brassicacearum]
MAKSWLFYGQIIQLLFMKGVTFIALRRGGQPEKNRVIRGRQVAKKGWPLSVKKIYGTLFPG